MNISNNISSINAHQTILNSSANNVANINTDRYVPTGVNITDESNSVKANVHKADSVSGGYDKSQTDLAKEFPDQMISQGGTAVNVSAIKTQDEMFGTLIDMKV